MGQALHLVGRFVGSLRPGPPSSEDERWALGHLGDGERDLWQRMSNPDRRHAVGVAREVVARWPQLDRPVHEADVPPREVVAAALLHDVGKVDAGLRTPARVLATLLWGVLDDRRAHEWAVDGSGLRSRLGRYRRHPEIGADLLRAAGADPLTAAWAEEHHRPAIAWSVDPAIGSMLKDCDDD